jgi:hypothetical protein
MCVVTNTDIEIQSLVFDRMSLKSTIVELLRLSNLIVVFKKWRDLMRFFCMGKGLISRESLLVTKFLGQICRYIFTAEILLSDGYSD